jgi:hypothetical protein
MAANPIDASIAKFDSGRLRNLAGMMVTKADDLKQPEEILLDIGAQNPAELLRAYRAKQAKRAASSSFSLVVIRCGPGSPVLASPRCYVRRFASGCTEARVSLSQASKSTPATS